MSELEIGTHLASLNLFVESDGKFYITVAGGNVDEIVKQAERVGLRNEGEWPELMARKLVASAENLPAIKRADGGENEG